MILIQALLVGILLGVGVLVLVARSSLDQQEHNNELLRDIRKFQLNPRTRIAQASVQSGPVSEEKLMRSHGRATAAKRVVVGGDEDSELHERMSRAVPLEDDDE